ncbi:hypothetical protein Btru_008338 [Bulinus truncatus]|nr:hypothetical protein Btru_008338 [Bulinus truncatus]
MPAQLFVLGQCDLLQRNLVEVHSPESLTHKQDFHQLGGPEHQAVEVDMMSDDAEHRRIKRDNSNNLDVVELPFLGKRFALYIALPRTVDGITDLERHITSSSANVQRLFEGLHTEHFYLSLPKFKIENTLDLKDVLSTMGMSTSFGPSADFSGINGSETGTVAVAASLIGISKVNILPATDPIVADQTCSCFLPRDRVNKQILFQGKFLRFQTIFSNNT